MKLNYSPGACSLAPHIVLMEAGFTFDLEKVDIPNKKTASGADYWAINPKGYVPALQLDNGEVLTEVSTILQYLADQKPASGLVPAAGTMPRYRLMEALNFIATEVHKSVGALFNPAMTPEMKEVQKAYITRRLMRWTRCLRTNRFSPATHSAWLMPICSTCSAGAASTRSTSHHGRTSCRCLTVLRTARRCRRR